MNRKKLSQKVHTVTFTIHLIMCSETLDWNKKIQIILILLILNCHSQLASRKNVALIFGYVDVFLINYTFSRFKQI